MQGGGGGGLEGHFQGWTQEGNFAWVIPLYQNFRLGEKMTFPYPKKIFRLRRGVLISETFFLKKSQKIANPLPYPLLSRLNIKRVPHIGSTLPISKLPHS